MNDTTQHVSKLAEMISEEIGIAPTEANQVLETLNERERIILHDRFVEKLSCEAISRKLRVTRERIRQLQNIALAKLRKAAGRLKSQKNTGSSAPEASEVDSLSLDALHLKSRTLTLLEKNGITTVGELRAKTAKELLLIRKFGKKAFVECKDALLSQLKISVDW